MRLVDGIDAAYFAFVDCLRGARSNRPARAVKCSCDFRVSDPDSLMRRRSGVSEAHNMAASPLAIDAPAVANRHTGNRTASGRGNFTRPVVCSKHGFGSY